MSNTENLTTAVPTDLKFYSQRAIALATFIGGPLAAGYLIRANYLKLNQSKKGLKALLISIAITIVLFAGVFMVPESIIDKLPSMVIPAVSTVISYYLVDNIQGDVLSKYKDQKEAFYSNWKAAGIGLLAVLILAVITFGSILLLSDDDSLAQYHSDVAVFSENEQQTLAIYDRLATADHDALVTELDTEVIPTWQENIALIQNASTNPKLPPELVSRNEALIDYAELRLQSFRILRRMLAEEEVSYLSEFQQVNKQIEAKLALLN